MLFAKMLYGMVGLLAFFRRFQFGRIYFCFSKIFVHIISPTLLDFLFWSNCFLFVFTFLDWLMKWTFKIRLLQLCVCVYPYRLHCIHIRSLNNIIIIGSISFSRYIIDRKRNGINVYTYLYLKVWNLSNNKYNSIWCECIGFLSKKRHHHYNVYQLDDGWFCFVPCLVIVALNYRVI